MSAQGAARRENALLKLYDLRFVCGDQAGHRHVWGASREDAIGRLVRNPSLFGVKHEHVEVLLAVELPHLVELE